MVAGSARLEVLRDILDRCDGFREPIVKNGLMVSEAVARLVDDLKIIGHVGALHPLVREHLFQRGECRDAACGTRRLQDALGARRA